MAHLPGGSATTCVGDATGNLDILIIVDRDGDEDVGGDDLLCERDLSLMAGAQAVNVEPGHGSIVVGPAIEVAGL